jgi:retron-type reverse transcriptase
MERRGLKYVRYADDFSIYCKSKYEAQKIGNEIYLFLIISVKVSHHYGKVSHLQKLGGFVCKCSNFI